MKTSIRIQCVLFLAVLSSCGGGGGGSGEQGEESLSPPPAQSSAFGAGTHLIGKDIAPGRYYSDPRSGCYWERLSGFGGTTDDIISNEFVAFDSLQEIVDIRESDLAFSTDSDCGGWFTEPRQGIQNNIPPGNWLVGNQISPGTYSVTAGSGCYWERLRGFSGESSEIIANEFVNSLGNELVSIASSDAGFNTDGDCGTWTRIDSVETARDDEMGTGNQSPTEIENNWHANRQQEQVP